MGGAGSFCLVQDLSDPVFKLLAVDQVGQIIVVPEMLVILFQLGPFLDGFMLFLLPKYGQYQSGQVVLHHEILGPRCIASIASSS